LIIGENSMFSARGIVTALITPLNKDGSLCRDCLKAMLEFQVSKGVGGLFLTGTYGEGVILPEAVRVELFKVALDVVGGKIPLLPHVGGSDYEAVLRLAKAARDLGYRAVSVVGPIYHRPTKRGLVEFYSYISRADVEIVVYNNKGRQGYNIGPDEFEMIAREVPAVVGIKDTSYDPDQLLELVKRFGGKYFIAGGGDGLIAYTFAVGAHAHICGISNLFPELAVNIYRAVTGGDLVKAFELQYQVNSLRKQIARFGVETQEVLREALKMRGIDAGYPPLQLSNPLDQKQLEELKRIVEQALKTVGVE